jgi:hypothetical protein
MVSEQSSRTLYAPLGKKFNSMAELSGALIELSNEGDLAAKEIVASWQSLRNQAQTIINQLCVKE